MLTDAQIEVAAREFCRMSGIDPETRMMNGTRKNSDGHSLGIASYDPAWKIYGERIVMHDILQHCIDFAKSEPTPETEV